MANQVHSLSNPRQPGMAAACRTHLMTRSSSSPTPYMSVHLEFLSLPAPGGIRCSKAPWKNAHLHIAGEDMITQEPTFALDAIERRIPPRTLVRFRQRTHDEVIESAPDIAFPARHGRDVGLHRGVAIGLRDLGIASRKKNRVRAGPLGAGLRWLTGCLVCHCVQSNTSSVRLNLLENPEVKV